MRTKHKYTHSGTHTDMWQLKPFQEITHPKSPPLPAPPSGRVDLSVARSFRRRPRTCWESSPSDRLSPGSSCSPGGRCWRWCGGTAAPAAPPSLHWPETRQEWLSRTGTAETTSRPRSPGAQGGTRKPPLRPSPQCGHVLSERTHGPFCLTALVC